MDLEDKIAEAEARLRQLGEIGFDEYGDVIEYLIEHPDAFLPPTRD